VKGTTWRQIKSPRYILLVRGFEGGLGGGGRIHGGVLGGSKQRKKSKTKPCPVKGVQGKRGKASAKLCKKIEGFLFRGGEERGLWENPQKSAGT